MKYGYEVSCLSDKGKVRENNEDTVICLQLTTHFSGNPGQYALLALADGVGGGVAGDRASRIAVTSFLRKFWNQFPTRSSRETLELIEEAFILANSEVLEASKTDPLFQGMATTLTIVYAQDADCFIGHIGDSRCYLLRKSDFRQLTIDQSIGRVLQQAVGASTVLSTFTKHLTLVDGDRILVCSDGLTNNVDIDIIAKITKQDMATSAICKGLIDEANASGGTDNISVALLSVKAIDTD